MKENSIDMSKFFDVAKDKYTGKDLTLKVFKNQFKTSKGVKLALGSPDRAKVCVNVDELQVLIMPAGEGKGYTYRNGNLTCGNRKIASMVLQMVGRMSFGEYKLYEGTVVDIEGKKGVLFDLSRSVEVSKK